jgi:ABC-type uncharacterized transport system permease subunit
MRDIFIFLLGALGTKMIDDNLPSLHYKNVAKAFIRYVAPLMFIAYIGLLYTAIRLTKNPEAKKDLQHSLAITLVAIVLASVLTNKKQPVPLQ